MQKWENRLEIESIKSKIWKELKFPYILGIYLNEFSIL